VPHINVKEHSSFAKVPGGLQIFTLNILWLQRKKGQIRMSVWSWSFTLTENVGWGIVLCCTPPTQWTVWQPCEPPRIYMKIFTVIFYWFNERYPVYSIYSIH